MKNNQTFNRVIRTALIWLCMIGCAHAAVVKGKVVIDGCDSCRVPDSVRVYSCGADSCFVDEAGMFRLTFAGSNPGDSIALFIEEGCGDYWLVNHSKLLHTVVPQDTGVLVMVHLEKVPMVKSAIFGNGSAELAANRQKEYMASLHKKLESVPGNSEQALTLKKQIEDAAKQWNIHEDVIAAMARSVSSETMCCAADIITKVRVCLDTGDLDGAMSILNSSLLDSDLDAAERALKRFQKTGKPLGYCPELAAHERCRIAHAYKLKAFVFLLRLQWNDAQKSFEKAIHFDSTDQQIGMAYGGFLASTGNYEKAAYWYEVAVQDSTYCGQTADLLTDLGKLYYRLDQFDKAANNYNRALTMYTWLKAEDLESNQWEMKIAEVWSLLTYVYQELEDSAAADSCFINATNLYDGSNGKRFAEAPEELAALRFEMGKFYLEQNKFGKAELQFRPLVNFYDSLLRQSYHAEEDAPRLAQTLSLLASTYQKWMDESSDMSLRKKGVDCVAQLAQVVTVFPDNAEVSQYAPDTIRYGKYFSKANDDYLAFRKVFQKAMNQCADNLYIDTEGTLLALRQAETLLKKILPLDEGYYYARELSDVYFNLSQYCKTPAERLDYSERVVKIGKEIFTSNKNDASLVAYAEALGNVSWVLLENRKFQQAEKAARTALSLPEKRAEAVFKSIEWINSNLVLALLFQGKYNKALAMYKLYCGKRLDDDETWNQVFLADFEELERAGVMHPDIQKIRELLQSPPCKE